VTGDNLIVSDTRFDERYLKLLDTFLEAGMNAGVKNFDGNTPLHFLRATTPLSRATGIVERLLDAGANIDARNRASHSPLLLMVRNEMHDGAVFKLLLQMGADPEFKSVQGHGINRLGNDKNKRLVRSILSSLKIDDAMGDLANEDVAPKSGSSSGFGIL
jgi:ankyrin repeat protein